MLAPVEKDDIHFTFDFEGHRYNVQLKKHPVRADTLSLSVRYNNNSQGVCYYIRDHGQYEGIFEADETVYRHRIMEMAIGILVKRFFEDTLKRHTINL